MIHSARLSLALFVAAVLAGPGCEGIELGGGKIGRGAGIDVPEDGLLIAKFTALEHAMDNLPDEDRRFVDAEYGAYGVYDRDSLHQSALVRLLKDRTPPVVEASELYSRSSNSQWHQGTPALKWTAAAAKDADHSARAKVVVGWMQSKIINQFTEYSLEFDGKSWNILGLELIETGLP